MFLLKTKLNRRKFLAYSGGTLAAGAMATKFSTIKAIASEHGKQSKEPGTKTVPSACAICVNKCSLFADVKDGVIHKLNPNHNFFKSRSMLCARGNVGAKVPYAPDRLKKPLIRTGKRGEGKWKEVSWDEAYDYIVENVIKLIDKYDNRSSIAFASTEGLQEEFFRHLTSVVGSTNSVRHPTLCLASNIQGYSSVYGTLPDADIANAKFVVMAGSNRAEAFITPDTIDLAKNRKEQTFVYLDPRATKSAALADKWFPIKPGTDMAVVLAMINVIISEGLYDKEFVDKYTHGFDQLREHVKKNTPEWAEKESEIPADEIRWMARKFAENAPASVWYPGRRSSFTANDVYYRRSCAILNAIVGAWDRKGGLIPKSGISLKSHEFIFPLYDRVKNRIDGGKVNFAADVLPEYIKSNKGMPKDEVAFLSEADGSWVLFRDAILKQKPYPVKGMFIYKQNPVESVPNRAKTLEMLKSMEFICTIDIQMSDTAWYSDVVLPESTYLERWDPAHSLSGVAPVVIFRQPVIEPLFDTKSMKDITVDLTEKFLQKDAFWVDAWEEDKAYMEDYVKTFKGVPMSHIIEHQLSDYPGAYKMLKEKGCFYKTDKIPYGKTLKEGARLKTKTGKIELASVRYPEAGLYALPVYQKPSQPPEGKYRFVVGRHAQFTQANTQNVPYLLEAYGHYENMLWIHPKSALKQGLNDGDYAIVKSSAGEQKVKVHVTEYTRPDTVFYLHGFGRLSKWLTNVYKVGASDAEILEDYAETISGNALLHETFVEIKKA